MSDAFQPQSLITAVSEPSQFPTVIRGTLPIVARAEGRRQLRRVEPRCHVCKASDEIQRTIHYMADQKTPLRATVDLVSNVYNVTLSVASLHNHLREHYLSGTVGEDLLESTAASFGVFKPQHLVPRFAAQAVLQHGFAAIAAGTVKVSVSDMLAASKMLIELESEGSAAQDLQMYQDAFSILLGAVYKSVGPMKFNSIMWALNSNPRMSEILSGMGMRSTADASSVAIAALEEDDAEMRMRRELILSF